MYFIIYIFLIRLRYVSLSFFLFPFFLILSLSFFSSHFYTSFLHSHSFTFIFALSIFLNLSFYLSFLLIRWVHSFIRLLFPGCKPTGPIDSPLSVLLSFRSENLTQLGTSLAMLVILYLKKKCVPGKFIECILSYPFYFRYSATSCME